MRETTYLDYAATAPIRPEAKAAVLDALEIGGNASSVHARGRAARDLIERARAEVAALVGAEPDGVVFTSGGVEADNLALSSAVAGGTRRVLIGATEHSAVIEAAAASGAIVDTLRVDSRGLVDLDYLSERLDRYGPDDGRPFVALMLANNETGAIHPIAEAAHRVHAAGGWLHVDAVAAAGKIAIDLETLGADSLALSAHKLGGPQGVGAFVFGLRAKPVRALHGGGHERGWRSGTENLPGIAGFAAAAARIDLAHAGAQAAWRDAAAARLVAAGVRIAGEGAPRLPNLLCLAAPDWRSDLQVMALDLEGVMVSGGSACASGKVKPSRVLEAMGYGDLASGGLRASGGWATTENDWAHFADAWLNLHARQSARRRASAAA